MLNETNGIPDTPTYVTNNYNLSLEGFIIGVVVLGIVFIVAIVFTFVAVCYGFRNSKQSYAEIWFDV